MCVWWVNTERNSSEDEDSRDTARCTARYSLGYIVSLKYGDNYLHLFCSNDVMTQLHYLPTNICYCMSKINIQDILLYIWAYFFPAYMNSVKFNVTIKNIIFKKSGSRQHAGLWEGPLLIISGKTGFSSHNTQKTLWNTIA